MGKFDDDRGKLIEAVWVASRIYDESAQSAAIEAVKYRCNEKDGGKSIELAVDQIARSEACSVMAKAVVEQILKFWPKG